MSKTNRKVFTSKYKPDHIFFYLIGLQNPKKHSDDVSQFIAVAVAVAVAVSLAIHIDGAKH